MAASQAASDGLLVSDVAALRLDTIDDSASPTAALADDSALGASWSSLLPPTIRAACQGRGGAGLNEQPCK